MCSDQLTLWLPTGPWTCCLHPEPTTRGSQLQGGSFQQCDQRAASHSGDFPVFSIETHSKEVCHSTAHVCASCVHTCHVCSDSSQPDLLM